MTVRKKPAVDLRMSSAEFDRIMRQALQVKPEAATAKKTKKTAKRKAVKK